MFQGTENNGRSQALQVFICDTKSKVISGGSALAGVAGVIIIGLGALAIFGPIGSPGCIGSMTGGGVLVIGGGSGLIIIAIKNSRNTSVANDSLFQEDLTTEENKSDLLPAEKKWQDQHDASFYLQKNLVDGWRLLAYNAYCRKFYEIYNTFEGQLSYDILLERLRLLESAPNQNSSQQLSTQDQYLQYYTLYFLEKHTNEGALSFQEWQTQQSNTN